MKIKLVDGIIIILLIFLIFVVSRYGDVVSRMNGIFQVLVGDQETAAKRKEQDFAPKSLKIPQSRISEILRQNAEMLKNRPLLPRDIGNPDDKAMLAEALDNLHHGDDVYDRELAVMILGEFNDPAAMKGILYALDDPDNLVRERAITEIRRWSDEQERARMFIKALGNDKPEIVVLALEAISEYQDLALRAKIEALSHGKNENIRVAAQTALERYDAE